MIINSKFKPAWWLPGPHLQTLWGAIVPRRATPLVRERLELPDGDFLDLDWVKKNKDTNRATVIVLHGLEGSAQSIYAKGILSALANQGYRAALMNFRGCSGEPNRLPKAYHSGETQDLEFVINAVKKRDNKMPVAAVGYSLGGNVLLKWLGETGKANPLQCAVAVSVPFLLNKSADRMQSGFSTLYQWYLLKKLQKKMIEKYQVKPQGLKEIMLKKMANFWEFDEVVTAPLHGFKSAKDYYARSSSRQFLKSIKVPTLIIHAKNDPFLYQNSIPTTNELAKSVKLELTEAGGHVGFISGRTPGVGNHWLEQRIPEFIQQAGIT